MKGIQNLLRAGALVGSLLTGNSMAQSQSENGKSNEVTIVRGYEFQRAPYTRAEPRYDTWHFRDTDGDGLMDEVIARFDIDNREGRDRPESSWVYLEDASFRDNIVISRLVVPFSEETETRGSVHAIYERRLAQMERLNQLVDNEHPEEVGYYVITNDGLREMYPKGKIPFGYLIGEEMYIAGE